MTVILVLVVLLPLVATLLFLRGGRRQGRHERQQLAGEVEDSDSSWPLPPR